MTSSAVWDFVRACASGLIKNGHIALFILVFFGASFLSRDMFGPADVIDETDTTPQVEEPLPTNIAKIEPMTLDEFLEQSDERVEGHRLCTFTDYRRANPEACDELDRQVDEATVP